MSPITINLDGVDAWKGGATLPPGRHTCLCTDAEEGKSSGGHFEIHLTWEATEGPERGGQIQDWVQITDASLGKVRQLLEATGVQIPAGEFQLTAAMLQGSRAALIVREGTKQDGTPRMEIAAYVRAEKGSDLGSDQGREFAHAGAAKSDDPPPF